MPTTSFSSPTATSAVNEKRRPPLTTLATRLISMTRSWRSRPCGLTLSTSVVLMNPSRCRSSELQAALAGALGEVGDLPVVAVAAAIEHAALDAGGLAALGEEGSGTLRALGGVQLADLVLGPARLREGVTAVVVDQLGVQAPVGAVHRKPRTRGGAADLGPHPPPAAKPALLLCLDCHEVSPRARRACRPCGGSARPRNGRPCPCRAPAGDDGGSAPRSRRRAACRCPGRSPRSAAGPRSRCPPAPAR